MFKVNIFSINNIIFRSPKGLKILAIEQYDKSGKLGTSSAGKTRIWRTSHPNKLQNDMMYEALELWHQIEEEFNTKLVYQEEMLNMGSK